MHTVAWLSGLRRWFKAPVSSEAWVRIPPLPQAPINRKDFHFFLEKVNHDKKRQYSTLLTAVVLFKISEKHTRKTILFEEKACFRLNQHAPTYQWPHAYVQLSFAWLRRYILSQKQKSTSTIHTLRKKRVVARYGT